MFPINFSSLWSVIKNNVKFRGKYTAKRDQYEYLKYPLHHPHKKNRKRLTNIIFFFRERRIKIYGMKGK